MMDLQFRNISIIAPAHKFLFVAGSVLGILISAISPSNAASIGVNFSGGGVHTISPSASPGIIPAINWNNIPGASGSRIILSDDSGTPTTTSLRFTSAGFYDFMTPTNTPNQATNTLYSSAIVGNNTISEVFVSLVGIPYSSYDLYVYASQDTYSTNELSITDGITTFYYRGNGELNSSATNLLRTTSTTPGSPTIGPGQYQIFSGLTNPNVTLTTDGSIHFVLANHILGFQIVDTTAAIPEPLTIGGAFAAVVFGAVMKRKLDNR